MLPPSPFGRGTKVLGGPSGGPCFVGPPALDSAVGAFLCGAYPPGDPHGCRRCHSMRASKITLATIQFRCGDPNRTVDMRMATPLLRAMERARSGDGPNNNAVGIHRIHGIEFELSYQVSSNAPMRYAARGTRVTPIFFYSKVRVGFGSCRQGSGR